MTTPYPTLNASAGAPARGEEGFEDYKRALTANQARVEANRCLYCSDAPCIAAGPTEINIPEFIRKIATGNERGSAKTIFDSNILGQSCARVCPVEVLCVGSCVYNHMGVPPIQIGQLQRYATDRAHEEGWRFYEAGASTGRRVALVGAGPASLAAAHELRRAGHGCVLFERRPQVGGLNVTGVAPYKMKADVGAREAEWVLGIGGVEVRAGVSVGAGEDVSFEDLEREFDAVFLGFGLGADSRLEAEGAGVPGVWGAVEFIEAFKLSQVDLSGVREAVVVGGGNTAVDAVRELIGLGVPSVTMAYRRGEDRMSGYAHEWRAAKVEGARGAWGLSPLGFERDAAGALRGVRLAEVDAACAPTGTERVLEAQLALLAIGQSKLAGVLAGVEGLAVERGCVRVDAEGRAGRAGYFAGGDCANGGKEVVNAAAEGKRAARAIDAFLGAGGSLRAHNSRGATGAQG